MKWFDSHCHLQNFFKKRNLEEIFSRSEKNNVSKMTAVGTSLDDWSFYKDLSQKFTNKVYYSVGLHPCYVKENFEEEIFSISEFLISDHRPVAIGEVGLDYYHLPKDKSLANRVIENQKVAFKAQIQIAQNASLPLIIHSRDAFEDCIKILDSSEINWNKVIFHCFSEGKHEIQKLNERGGIGSFTGIITYKKNEHLREAMKFQGIENVILETDCPYLSPEPKRGIENEPANLSIIGKYISDFTGTDIHKISEWSFSNTCDFYNIK